MRCFNILRENKLIQQETPYIWHTIDDQIKLYFPYYIQVKKKKKKRNIIMNQACSKEDDLDFWHKIILGFIITAPMAPFLHHDSVLETRKKNI